MREKNTVQEVADGDEETNTQIMDGSIGVGSEVKEIVAGLGQTGLFSNTIQSENFMMPDISSMTLEQKILAGQFKPSFE